MGEEDREGVFAHIAVGFVQRDVDLLRRLTHHDVVMSLAGSSSLAGTYRGREDVARVVMGLRRVVRCTAHPIRFAHDADRMMVHRDVAIVSDVHRVSMTLHISLRFDRLDRVREVVIEPSDPGLFDHVINTEVRERTGSLRIKIPDLGASRARRELPHDRIRSRRHV